VGRKPHPRKGKKRLDAIYLGRGEEKRKRAYSSSPTGGQQYQALGEKEKIGKRSVYLKGRSGNGVGTQRTRKEGLRARRGGKKGEGNRPHKFANKDILVYHPSNNQKKAKGVNRQKKGKEREEGGKLTFIFRHRKGGGGRKGICCAARAKGIRGRSHWERKKKRGRNSDIIDFRWEEEKRSNLPIE